MEKVKIQKLDNFGRGICYVNNKIVFVKDALPNEEVVIDIIKDTKKYSEAIVLEYISVSSKREKSMCPYYKECDGCHLRHMSYQDMCKFKINKVEDIFKKYAHIETKLKLIESPKINNYRNKVTIKIKDGNIGYFKEKSHEIVSIDNCLLASDKINAILNNLSKLKIKNGEVTIRCNYQDKILISINSLDKIDIEDFVKDNDIVGIVLNDKTIYGDNYFIDKISDLDFKVSYNSFFQVNPYITSLLFQELNKIISNNSKVLDLYCGVGSLGISVSSKVNKLYGIEVIDNAIVDAKFNAKNNNLENTTYYCGKVEDLIIKLLKDIDVVIVDPPREGLDNKTKEELINIAAKNIIYVSCDPLTLARDLNDLKDSYEVREIKALDMFPNTYHVECVCILNCVKAL